ncbi:MAG: FtsX-like permease family protein, partial [Flavobacteriales bacterium]|nr:FtsX-like permease family protein [Flavobacteriales bacterium]
NVIILGKDIVDKVFPPSVEPVGKEVSVADKKYMVIGTLEPKGNTFGFAGDNQCMIPVSNLRKNFAGDNTEYSINVRVKESAQMEKAISDAKGLLRIVRRDKPGQPDSFEIEKSDSLAGEVIGMTDNLKFGAIFIGLITLASAGIGLMNIMLVSVSERTREIGVRKSIGASSSTIRRQFLIESIVIGQIGGIIGILLGIALANVISSYVGFGVAVPWFWMIFGAFLCFLVSVVSGYYPAGKAAKLDPIEALRYE